MNWGKTREDWRKARDSHGIKKGAVSGVSIGDAIEKVVKAEGKGYAVLLSAAEALKTALEKYQTGLKKAKNGKDFSDWIDKNILKDTNALIAEAKADLATARALLKQTRNTVTLDAIFPDLNMAAKAEEKMKHDPSLTWAAAAAMTDQYKLAVACCKDVATTAKSFKTITFLHPLTNDHAANLISFGKDLETDVKEALGWITCKSREDFLLAHQKARGRDWASLRLREIDNIFTALTK
jgi:hypothetical protein